MHPLVEPFLKSKPNPTPTDLREAQDAVEAQIAVVESKLGKLQRERTDALVNGGTYSRIDEIDAGLRHGGVDLERLGIIRTELTKMVSDAEQQADEAERDAIYGEAVGRQTEALRLFEEYAEAAQPVVAILERLVEAEQAIVTANLRLSARGDPRSVAGVETAYWGREDRQPLHLTYPPWSLVSHAKLPSHDLPNEWLWPKAPQP